MEHQRTVAIGKPVADVGPYLLLRVKKMSEPLLSESELPVIVLKARSDRRIKGGHRWLYSNEIDQSRSQCKQLEMGQMVSVVNANHDPLGSAFFNGAALLCGRLYSRKTNVVFNNEIITQRISAALEWRSRCYSAPYYRLVYGDGDGLPGLVVDRYGDILVLQITNAGMMQLRESICGALVSLLSPAGILLRNDNENSIEQLPSVTEVLYGTVPDVVDMEENGVSFSVPVREGQKTGWFYDHRESRALLAKYSANQRVLDVYSYLGGWGRQALAAGAESLVCIDSSAAALDAILQQEKARPDCVEVIKANAIEALKTLVNQGAQFDVVVLDPPAFIKRRKDQRSGEKAYHHINQLAVKLLAENGLLVSASCSLHLSREALTKTVETAAHKVGKMAMIVHQGGLGADHPIHPMMPEMDYLQAVFARIGNSI